MNFQQRYLQAQTRRHFLQQGALSLGSVALGALLNEALAQGANPRVARPVRACHADDNPLALKKPMLLAKAKNIIYLHMSGAPPQHDLFDYKPKLKELHLKPCPESL